MLTSVSTDTIANTTERLKNVSGLVNNLVVVAVVVVAFFMCIILTRPLNRLTRAISEVKEGKTGSGGDEKRPDPDVETAETTGAPEGEGSEGEADDEE